MKKRKELNSNKKEFSYNKTRQKLSDYKQETNLNMLDFTMQPLLALL